MSYDVIIIGAGPAGYVAAIRAGQVGLKTAIIEKEKVGGMCLNWGCIPSKSMIESAKLFKKISKDAGRFGIDGINKKELSFNYTKATKRAGTIVNKLTTGVGFLLKKNGVELITGSAIITSANSVSVENRLLETKNIIIATGSKQPLLEIFPGENTIEIKDLFSDIKLPQQIAVLGYGAVAVELTQLFKLIGKDVTLLADNDKILPLADEYLSDYIEKQFKKERIKIIKNFDKSELEKYNDGKIILDGKEIEFDKIINAQKRIGVIPDSDIDIQMEGQFIKTDDECQTNVQGIYAIGDVNGKSQFAHIGSAQGLFVINKLKGIKGKLNIKNHPLNMYTFPEISQIGLTESDLMEQKIDYKISEFPLSANGKALTEGNSEGFIRILSENKYGEVLGVQIVASNATDMIAEASAYMQLESTVYDIAQTVHAHPTVSEIFMEAGFEGVDKAIHK